MSDSDDNDMPELVASSSDEESPVVKGNEDFAANWLSKPKKFLDKQDYWMRVFALAPFLFAINNIPSTWVKALIHSKMLLDERQFELKYLSWEEWECVDLMDEVVIPIVLENLRNCKTLVNILECLGRLDHCKTGVIIDVDLVTKEAEKCPEITRIWKKVMESELSAGKEKAAKFGVLYVMKLYEQHVLSIGMKSKDFSDVIRTDIRTTSSVSNAEIFKTEGNKAFNNSAFSDAVDHYTKAARADPLNHIYYGNRAQAYSKQKKYHEALADGRRAVTLKPDWAKGHYRYAQAFYKLGQLDTAIKVNEHGLEQCQNSKETDISNVKELETQGKKFTEERANGRTKLTSLPKHLVKKLDDIPGSQGTDSDRDAGSSESDSESSHQRDKPKKKTKKRNSEPSGKQADFSKASGDKKSHSRRSEKEEFQSHLLEGSTALVGDINKGAMMAYQKALDMISHVPTSTLGIDESDTVTLKYAFSVAAIGTRAFKSIQDGIEKLTDIINNHQEIRFPMAYYGLGKAYVTLNRFPEAMSPLENGLKILKNISLTRIPWPGTKILIPESDTDHLRKCLVDLMDLCWFPPKPDAMCRYHSDKQDTRAVIYYSDPDFKGFIRLLCHLQCIIAFHPGCWKDYKTQMNKTTDKEMLDTVCPTPDCRGTIVNIRIVRHDSLHKELVSEKTALKEVKEKTPVLKMKSTSAVKLAKKQEKKLIKKARRREKQEEKDDLLEDVDNMLEDKQEGALAAERAQAEVKAVPLPDVKEAVVLKKDEKEPEKQTVGKQKKTKKKKDKKQVLTLEVNFTDRKEETLLGENSVLSDEEQQKEVSAHEKQTFSVPVSLQSQIQNFERTYTGNDQKLFRPDEITENVFSYFIDMLDVSGPLAIDDPKITMELEVFPQEAHDKIKQAGGLGDFLKQSLKFAVIDDVVCLLKDAVRARDLALRRREERASKGLQKQAHDAWKTVGKNNVDSLEESLGFSGKTASIPPVNYSYGGVSGFDSNFPSAKTSTNFPALPTFNKNIPPVGGIVAAGNTNNSNSSLPRKPLMIPNSGGGGQVHGMNDLDSFEDFYSMPQSKSERQLSPGFEAMDSIDDFPVVHAASKQKKSGKLDDLDNFEMVSETGSDGYLEGNASDHDSLSSGVAHSSNSGEVKRAFLNNRDDFSVSRSSSRSDISERSDLSDKFPKPIRTLGMPGHGFGTPNTQSPIGSEMENNRESVGLRKEDFESIDNTGSPDFVSSADISGCGYNAAKEVERSGKEFVRKNDEMYVTELAHSVVEKLYQGRVMSDSERRETLTRVTADIWADFNKSAGNIGVKQSAWPNSTKDASYNKSKLGQFADSFMKQHYQSSVPGVSSMVSTSSLNVNTPSSLSFGPSVSSSGYPMSTLSSSAPEYIPQSSRSSGIISPVNNSKFTGSSMNSSEYGLFSGPQLGFNSTDPFSSQSSSSGPFYTSSVQRPIGSSLAQPMPSSSSFTMNFPPPSTFPLPAPIQLPSADKGIQTSAPENVKKDAEVNTDPYEPYRMEYLRMKEERDRLQALLSESKMFSESLLKEYKVKNQNCQTLQDELSNKVSQFDMEHRNWENEKQSYREEMYRINQHVGNIEAEKTELKNKMIDQEKRVTELARLANEQREKYLLELKKIQEVMEQFRQSQSMQQERAQNAEMDLVKAKLQSAVQTLERQFKEASFHLQHLGGLMKKYQDDHNPIPLHLLQSKDHWKQVAEKCEAMSTKVKGDYESQLLELSHGKELSQLTPVNIPNLPALPEQLCPGGGMMSNTFQPSKSSIPQRQPSFPDFSMATSSAMPATITTANHVQNSFSMATVSLPQKPTGVPPKPLSTPQRAQSLVPPRPLSGARAPLGAPLRAPLRTPFPPPLAAAKNVQTGKNSYEKLLIKLQIVFPHVNKSDFPRLIQELRQHRGGSLSGMTIEDIISQISDMIEAASSSSMKPPSPAATHPLAPPPGLANSMWGTGAGVGGGAMSMGGVSGAPVVEVFQDEEDPCVICHEELTIASTITLECTHKFHDSCIRKWLREQSTCPNCRVHALLPDEFPSLM